jgi:alcohol dehydrogenase
MARTARASAVIVSDPLPTSRDRALGFGATHAVSADPPQLGERVRELTDGRGADVVFELAGTSSSAQTSLALVRTGGTVVLAGTVAPVGNVAFDPEAVVRRMLTIRGAHNYHPRDLSRALAFLAGPGRDYPWESLVVADYALAETEQAFADAHNRPGVRVAIRPDRKVSA